MISCCLEKQNFQKTDENSLCHISLMQSNLHNVVSKKKTVFSVTKRALRHLATLLTLKTILSSLLAPSRHKRSSQKQQGKKREEEEEEEEEKGKHFLPLPPTPPSHI